jgi:hypothetical protein
MPLTSRTPWPEHRALRWTAAVVVAVLVMTGAVVVGLAHGRSAAHRHGDGPQAVSPIQGPVRKAATIRDRHGRRHTCPHGAVPGVVIEGVHVYPEPAQGLWLLPGRYRLAVRGRLVNESSAPIDVRGVHLSLGHAVWSPTTPRAHAVGADSSTSFRLRAPWHSRTTQRLALRARLSWQWQDSSVRACGTKGLVEDD